VEKAVASPALKLRARIFNRCVRVAAASVKERREEMNLDNRAKRLQEILRPGDQAPAEGWYGLWEDTYQGANPDGFAVMQIILAASENPGPDEVTRFCKLRENIKQGTFQFADVVAFFKKNAILFPDQKDSKP